MRRFKLLRQPKPLVHTLTPFSFQTERGTAGALSLGQLRAEQIRDVLLWKTPGRAKLPDVPALS